MIKIENVDADGFEHALRAMRNPMNSWNKASYESDLKLMRQLYKAGAEHRTYARMIIVWMDVTAPLYWWKEMDRYTVGKTQISTSTMHKIHAKQFEEEDFSCEHLFPSTLDHLDETIFELNYWRDRYIKTGCKNKDLWWQMIQLLPSTYNQKRTICLSYETIFKIIRERTGHKLDEWGDFIEEAKKLPYISEIMEDVNASEENS